MISNALFTMNKDNRITQDAFYSYCFEWESRHSLGGVHGLEFESP